jgi:integrase
MSVRQRNYRDPATGAVTKVWMVDVDFTHPDGHRQRIRKRSPVQTRRGAEQYERDLRASLLSGTFGRKEIRRPTLAEFADEFIENYAVANNRLSEVYSKRWTLRLHLLPRLGHLRLDAISPRDIEGFKAYQLKAGYCAKSVNNHLAVLRRMPRVAVEWQILDSAPSVRPLKAPKPRFEFLDFEEAARLEGACEGQWQVMVTMALNTGLRLGELLGLRWQDCDLVRTRLVVRQAKWRDCFGPPKSGRQREVPLNAKVIAVLKRHRHLRSELVFCHEDGAPLSYAECHRPLVYGCQRAGLRHVQWHALRHYAERRIMPSAR